MSPLFLFVLACAPDAGQPAETSPDTTSAAPVPTFARLDDGGLGATATAAVARMPNWLKGDLSLAFQELGSDRQDEIAGLIVDLDDPALLDEVGFAIAHLSKGVLKSDNFYPELVVENARGIYAADPLLDYVELVESGDPEVDADWHTTTRYRVQVEGVVEEIDLDPEIYYWFIVHPRIEDENPWYIDAWAECTRDGLECATDPESGSFWRTFLWDEATTTCPEGEVCPVLTEYLPGVDLLYGATEGYDAVHAVAAMMLASPEEAGRWFSFGAYGERSIQPNRIYGLGRGNCGEWADMTTALSRTALIPNVNVTPSSWDHTWNGFYMERWVGWEPVNWAFDVAYGSGYVTYATRGDASMWYQTEQYNSTTATLEIQIRDTEGDPVDGATVTLWSPYDTSYWYAGELVTDGEGVASFTVGADKEFGYLVTSELGDYPGTGSLDEATSGIAVGETVRVRAKLDGTMPHAPALELVDAGDTPILVETTVEGRLSGDSYRLGDRSTQPAAAPPLSTWVLTEADYDAFRAGEAFTALTGNLDPAATYVVVVANLDRQSTSAVGAVVLTVGDVVWTDDLALPPGEHLAVRVGPAR